MFIIFGRGKKFSSVYRIMFVGRWNDTGSFHKCFHGILSVCGTARVELFPERMRVRVCELCLKKRNSFVYT